MYGRNALRPCNGIRLQRRRDFDVVKRYGRPAGSPVQWWPPALAWFPCGAWNANGWCELRGVSLRLSQLAGLFLQRTSFDTVGCVLRLNELTL